MGPDRTSSTSRFLQRNYGTVDAVKVSRAEVMWASTRFAMAVRVNMFRAICVVERGKLQFLRE